MFNFDDFLSDFFMVFRNWKILCALGFLLTFNFGLWKQSCKQKKYYGDLQNLVAKVCENSLNFPKPRKVFIIQFIFCNSLLRPRASERGRHVLRALRERLDDVPERGEGLVDGDGLLQLVAGDPGPRERKNQQDVIQICKKNILQNVGKIL